MLKPVIGMYGRPKFCGETFAGGSIAKAAKFMNVFSLESFPLYSNWHIVLTESQILNIIPITSSTTGASLFLIVIECAVHFVLILYFPYPLDHVHLRYCDCMGSTVSCSRLHIISQTLLLDKNFVNPITCRVWSWGWIGYIWGQPPPSLPLLVPLCKVV